MWKFIRKWWLLQQLDKEITRHSIKAPAKQLSSGREVLLSQGFFIAGSPIHPKYPGIAQKSVRRFSSILRWRRKDSADKLKKRIHEYNNIFKSCVKEGYITMEPTEVIRYELPSVANPLADNIHGWLGLLQALLLKYYLAWTVIVIPFILGIYGSSYIKQLFDLAHARLGI